MVALYTILISLSLIFVFMFIKQLFNVHIFLKQLKKKEVININRERKAILKKKLQLMKAKKRIKLQSKIFFAKFLFDKPYVSLPLSLKFLIDDIYKKLCLNPIFLTCKIDYDKLKNSAVFNGKPIYKVVVKNNHKELQNLIFSLTEVYKFTDFRTIFLLDEESDNNFIKEFISEKAKPIDYKIILLKDINLKLLQEINKLNLNYKPEENKEDLSEDFNFTNLKFDRVNSNLKVEEYLCKGDKLNIRLVKFLNVEDSGLENARVCYYVNFLNNSNHDKTIKFHFIYRLKSEFFNIKRQDNNFIIDYFNKKNNNEYFYFNNDLNNFKIIKNKSDIFIKFEFKIKILRKANSLFAFVSAGVTRFDEINKLDILKLIYFNNLNIEKLLNLKIFIKNNQFNLFFNKLKNLIIEEKLNQNKLSNKFILPRNIFLNLTKNFNISYKRLVDVASYYDLYKFLVVEVFGIRIKGEIVYINPNKNYYNQNFKLIFIDENAKIHSVYVDQNSESKGLQVGEVIYANLRVVDLSLIDKNAKLSI